MALHILELPKFAKAVEDLATPLDRWLFFLRHAPALDTDSLPESLNVPEVRWALGDLMMISRSKRDLERYEAREKMQRDVYTALAEKFDEGRGEGREEGRDEERRALVQYLHKRLRQDVMDPDALQALSPSELADLVARLQAELDAKLAFVSE